MEWFARRPLTWLFWIALLCGIAAGLRDRFEGATGLLLFGAMYVIGAWAAVGALNRLARGAILAVAPLAPAAAIWYIDGNPDVARDALAFAMLIVWPTSVVALVLTLALNHIGRGANLVHGAKWQISLVEILGWTIVVAIASFSASIAHLPATKDIHEFWAMVLTPLPAATIAACFLGARPRRDRLGVVVTGVAMAAYYFFAHRWDDIDGKSAAIYAAMFGMVALWALVTRLDENAAERAVISKWWPRRNRRAASND